MASPASRLILQKNVKSFPLHLLRGYLPAASSSTRIAFSDSATSRPSTLPVFPQNHFACDLFDVGTGCNKQGILGWRFVGGYPEATSFRVEASGKKTEISDEDEVGKKTEISDEDEVKKEKEKEVNDYKKVDWDDSDTDSDLRKYYSDSDSDSDCAQFRSESWYKVDDIPPYLRRKPKRY